MAERSLKESNMSAASFNNLTLTFSGMKLKPSQSNNDRTINKGKLNNGYAFDVNKWLESINVWDEKYDYVMHDDHWLTSKWSVDCEKCQAAAARQQSNETYDLNETFDLYRSALEETPHPKQKNHFQHLQLLQPQIMHSQQPQNFNQQPPQQTLVLQQQQHHHQQPQPMHQQQHFHQHQQSSSSKIPKIPTRYK